MPFRTYWQDVVILLLGDALAALGTFWLLTRYVI